MYIILPFYDFGRAVHGHPRAVPEREYNPGFCLHRLMSAQVQTDDGKIAWTSIDYV
jgi:hypothetical protein